MILKICDFMMRFGLRRVLPGDTRLHSYCCSPQPGRLSRRTLPEILREHERPAGANNARAGLDRLAMLVSMNASAPSSIEPLIAEAVHVLVHIARTHDGSRKIESILEVRGYEDVFRCHANLSDSNQSAGDP